MKRLGLSLPLGELSFKEGEKQTRPPFSEDWIRLRLLASGALDGLNGQAHALLLGMINTGYRPSEGAALTADTIRLDGDVPHISIEPEGRQLKSHYARRVIPLTGVSLEAFTGRVLARDLAGDGIGDRVQLVIDGTDGRVHQIELRADRCDGIGRGMIVAAAPPPTEPRVADRNIAAAAGSDGTYHPSRHIEIARAEKIAPDPERFVAAHMRRLEALRRAGIVERWSEDHWKVPQDLRERGLAHDRKGHGPGARMEMLSPIGLDRQITHDGATWLDKELMRQGSTDLRETGFGLEMKRAMGRRKQVLVQRGDVQDLGQGRIRAPRDLVHRLEAREIDRVGRAMAADRGHEWAPVKPGNRFGGELVGSTQLPSGRFAMIDNGLGFSLVPWNDALERRIGQQIGGIGLPGGGVDWAFGRKRGLGL